MAPRRSSNRSREHPVREPPLMHRQPRRALLPAPNAIGCSLREARAAPARCCPVLSMVRGQLLATGCASAHGHRAAAHVEAHGSAGGGAAQLVRATPRGLQDAYQKVDMLECKPAWPCSAARDSMLLCSLSSLPMLKLSSMCFEISYSVVPVGHLNDQVAVSSRGAPFGYRFSVLVCVCVP